MRVWKYDLHVAAMALGETRFSFEIPSGARLLHVREQNSRLAMWFEVDPGRPAETRTFEVVGTGDGPTEGWLYHGTVFFNNATLVLHVYEKPNQSKET